MIDNMTISKWIMRGIAVIIALTIHEFSHGIVSHMQGDRTAKSQGRLTLNPIAHIDILGLIALFVFRFGWAKPIQTNPSNYRKPRIGIILTSIAGPLANLLMAFVAILVILITRPENEAISLFYSELIFINTALAVFNMIPIPPLDGSKILASIFGGRVAEIIFSIEGKGTLFIFLLLNLPIVNSTLSNMIVFSIQKLVDLGLLITFKG